MCDFRNGAIRLHEKLARFVDFYIGNILYRCFSYFRLKQIMEATDRKRTLIGKFFNGREFVVMMINIINCRFDAKIRRRLPVGNEFGKKCVKNIIEERKTFDLISSLMEMHLQCERSYGVSEAKTVFQNDWFKWRKTDHIDERANGISRKMDPIVHIFFAGNNIILLINIGRD